MAKKTAKKKTVSSNTARLSFNLANIRSAANTAYGEQVIKAITKKMRVVAKRTNQLDAHRAIFDDKVAAMEADLSSAPNATAALAVLEKYKFPASSICLHVRQDD
jgi:hypothetical protein